MNSRVIGLLVLAMVFVLSFVGGSRLNSESLIASAAARSAAAQAISTTLGDNDQIVAGTADNRGGIWVVARDGGAQPLLAAYHVTDVGAQPLRVPLGIHAAGRLAGAAVAADGTVWVGAGNQLVKIDPASGVLANLSLPAATKAVTHAQRAPDGTVLGLGQVVSLAIDASGALWVSRYAVPSLLSVDPSSGSMRTVELPVDTDPDRLLGTGDGLWFTTNFGTDDRLGARIGHLNATGSIQFQAEPTASMVLAGKSIHTFGSEWHQRDAMGALVATHLLPNRLDLRATTINQAGQLVARGAREATLHVIDQSGLEVRAISYSVGSFVTRGRTFQTTAPLAFILSTPDGKIWFGAESGNTVYAAR
jgi:hypothetical protein